jgi:hypothetical protein
MDKSRKISCILLFVLILLLGGCKEQEFSYDKLEECIVSLQDQYPANDCQQEDSAVYIGEYLELYKEYFQSDEITMTGYVLKQSYEMDVEIRVEVKNIPFTDIETYIQSMYELYTNAKTDLFSIVGENLKVNVYYYGENNSFNYYFRYKEEMESIRFEVRNEGALIDLFTTQINTLWFLLEDTRFDGTTLSVQSDDGEIEFYVFHYDNTYSILLENYTDDCCNEDDFQEIIETLLDSYARR